MKLCYNERITKRISFVILVERFTLYHYKILIIHKTRKTRPILRGRYTESVWEGLSRCFLTMTLYLTGYTYVRVPKFLIFPQNAHLNSPLWLSPWHYSWIFHGLPLLSPPALPLRQQHCKIPRVRNLFHCDLAKTEESLCSLLLFVPAC